MHTYAQHAHTCAHRQTEHAHTHTHTHTDRQADTHKHTHTHIHTHNFILHAYRYPLEVAQADMAVISGSYTTWAPLLLD